MPLQDRVGLADLLDADHALAQLELDDAIHEQERVAMGDDVLDLVGAERRHGGRGSGFWGQGWHLNDAVRQSVP